MSTNREIGVFSSPIPGAPVTGRVATIRDSISSDDVANPATGTGKSDMIGFNWARFYVKIEGTSTPTWTVTFLLLSPTGDEYGEALSRVFEGAKVHVVDLMILGNSNVNARVDTSSGTNPVVTIMAQGFNNNV